MMTEDILKRIDELLEIANKVSDTKFTKKTSSHTSSDFVDHGLFMGFRAAALSFLSQVFGPKHTYYVEFDKATPKQYSSCLSAGQHILKAARKDIAEGWLFTIEGRVSAEIFADFIALAKEALDDNKDVAAVLACAALEDALKRVAIKENLDVDDKDMSEVINALKAGGTLKGPQAKIVQSYVKLRNKAFHADWEKIDKESVSSLIGFTEQFLLTHFS